MTRWTLPFGQRSAYRCLAVLHAVLRYGTFVALLGCDSTDPAPLPHDNPSVLRDVTGVEFGWQCGPGTEACSLSFTASTPPPDPCPMGTTAGYGNSWGRFFEICSICVRADGVWSTTAGQCRVAACQTDADCPVIVTDYPVSVFACQNELCQSTDTSRFPAGSLKRFEVEGLCFANYDRSETDSPTSAASIQVQAELDGACMGTSILAPCSVPPDCRAP